MKSLFSWFDEVSGKITGLDFNIFEGFRLNKDDALAILKYTLDLRLENNRAPLLFGAHSQYYNARWICNGEPDDANRRWVIEEFVKYALSKQEVRIVPFIKIIEWLRDPVALSDVTAVGTKEQPAPGSFSISVTPMGFISATGISSGMAAIFSLSGQKIAQQGIVKGISTARVSLRQGMYLIRIEGKQGNRVQRVVVY